MMNPISRVGLAALAMLAAANLAGCAALPPIAGTPDAAAGAAGSPATGAAANAAAVDATTAPPSSALAPHKVGGGWMFSFRGGTAQSVALAGDFNAWSTSANPLKKGDGDVWSVVTALAPGDHLYKFVVNGTEWKPDPENTKFSDDGYGGKNSTVHVE